MRENEKENAYPRTGGIRMCDGATFLNVFLRVFGRMHTKLKQRRLRVRRVNYMRTFFSSVGLQKKLKRQRG